MAGILPEHHQGSKALNVPAVSGDFFFLYNTFENCDFSTSGRMEPLSMGRLPFSNVFLARSISSAAYPQ